MNILHLNSNIKFGGSEQQLIYLVDATSKNNINNFIFCFETSDLENMKSEISATVFGVRKQKKFHPSLLLKLKKIVKNNNIDLIHIHTGRFILTYMLADLLLNLNCRAIFSKKDMSPNSSWFSKIKYNYKGIYKTTCVTEAIQERFKTILYPKNHQKLCVIRDGLFLDNLKVPSLKNIHNNLNIPSNKIIIGNIANHVDAKDLNTLLLVLDYLVNVKKINTVHIVQIGRFSRLTNELKKKVEEKKLQNHITFTDFIKNGFEYTSQFDYFLMTSKSEGMPLSILESFYYKIPVISTKAGGIPEVLVNKENGLLSEIEDYKQLSENIILLMNDTSLKNELINNAYNLVVNKFDHHTMADKTIKIYNDIIKIN
jgi:glycosyltransferase involved in cell wall biosynthesis